MTDAAAQKPNVSRRDFARKAALAAATAAVVPRGVLSSPMELGGSPTSQAQAQESKLSSQNQAEADTMFQAILREHGNQLSDAQKTDLRRLVNEAQKPLEALRAFALDTADQPANVLKLYPDPKTEAHPSKSARS
jgi:hypothetical protein